MRKRFAALVVASALVVPAAAQAATTADTHVGASASQASELLTMKSALRKDVKRALKAVAKRDLASIASKGFTLKRIRALAAGKVSLTATARTTAGRRITVTKGSRTFGKLGKKNVRVKLTRSGKRLLDTSNRITLRLRATFRPSTCGRVTVVFKVTLKRKPGSTIGPEGGTPPPAVPAAGIPADATPLYSQNFESPRDPGPEPWGGLFEQCADAGSVESGQEGGEGFARLTLPAEAVALPFDAGPPAIERCELSHGGYDRPGYTGTREPGEYWYHAKLRLGDGYPHDGSNSLNWTTIQQWQEDRNGGSTGRVDGAMFVNSNAGAYANGGMYLDGQFLTDADPDAQSDVFNIHTWHDIVVHGVWTDQPNGYLEWRLDGVKVGRTNGVTSQTGGRHFWKGGITRAETINATQVAEIAEITVYRD